MKDMSDDVVLTRRDTDYDELIVTTVEIYELSNTPIDNKQLFDLIYERAYRAPADISKINCIRVV